MKYQNGQPRGGVIEQYDDTNWLVGSRVGAGWSSKYPDLVTDTKEWSTKYKLGLELQAPNGKETNSCTNHASLKVIAKQMKFNCINGLYSQEIMDFLTRAKIWFNGEIYLSESFDAVMSGTDPNQGNSLVAVCSGKGKFGIVSELIYPDDHNNFYKKPTQEAIDLGKESLKYFSFPYAWVFYGRTTYDKGVMASALAHCTEAPLLGAVPVCSPWDSNVEFCGRTQSDHAVCVDGGTAERPVIDDSYDPQIKTLDKGYVVNALMKLMVVSKFPYTPKATADYVVVSGKNPKYHRSLWMKDKTLEQKGIIDYVSFATGDVLKALPALQEYANAQPSQTLDEFPPNTGRTLAILNWEDWNKFNNIAGDKNWWDKLQQYLNSLNK